MVDWNRRKMFWIFSLAIISNLIEKKTTFFLSSEKKSRDVGYAFTIHWIGFVSSFPCSFWPSRSSPSWPWLPPQTPNSLSSNGEFRNSQNTTIRICLPINNSAFQFLNQNPHRKKYTGIILSNTHRRDKTGPNDLYEKHPALIPFYIQDILRICIHIGTWPCKNSHTYWLLHYYFHGALFVLNWVKLVGFMPSWEIRILWTDPTLTLTQPQPLLNLMEKKQEYVCVFFMMSPTCQDSGKERESLRVGLGRAIVK